MGFKLNDGDLNGRLLAWYDLSAREMPWRIGPAERKRGSLPDPYRVWLSEIMLQQTTVPAVARRFGRFVEKWPDAESLAAAKDAEVMAEWAGLGYYARARNLIKCARAIASEHGGKFPESRESLLSLPGIGPYTANAICAIAFDQPRGVLDGNVERVMARHYAVDVPLPGAKRELQRLIDSLTTENRPGDFAQAIMDLGATVCLPKAPRCPACPWSQTCAARRRGNPEAYPVKAAKRVKPVRRGFAYVAARPDGSLLLETREAKGLLGGMLGWPGSEWSESPRENPPLPGNWTEASEEVRHTFTHFHLRLRVKYKVASCADAPRAGDFVSAESFSPSALPTVMRKVYSVYLGDSGQSMP